MYPYEATGKLRYNGDWVLLDVHYSIAAYYRSIIRSLRWVVPTSSYHGDHITVVAGKYQKPLKNYGYRDGERIRFTYGKVMTENNSYYWLEIVDDSELRDIRLNLGLEPTPFHPFHLTVGHVDENHLKRVDFR